MVKIGDWRNDHALEIPLDGVGGVSLLVRAEVHRKGNARNPELHNILAEEYKKASTSHSSRWITRLKPKDWPNWRRLPGTKSTVCPTTSSGTLIPRKKLET